MRLGPEVKLPARGFTLVELLIVVGILAVLAAIAIPQYNGMVRRAREVAAISYMKQWYYGQMMYKEKYGWFADADEKLVNERFIALGFAKDGSYSRYMFSIDSPSKSTASWWGKGVPQNSCSTCRYFYTDSTGAIRYEFGKNATATSPPI